MAPARQFDNPAMMQERRCTPCDGPEIVVGVEDQNRLGDQREAPVEIMVEGGPMAPPLVASAQQDVREGVGGILDRLRALKVIMQKAPPLIGKMAAIG